MSVSTTLVHRVVNHETRSCECCNNLLTHCDCPTLECRHCELSPEDADFVDPCRCTESADEHHEWVEVEPS